MSIKVYIDNTERFRDEEEFYRAYCLMPEFRKKKIDGIVFPEKKRASLMAGFLLKRGLFDAGIDDIEVYSDITRFALPIGTAGSHYDIDKDAVPYEEGDDIYFSISHSGEFAMCVTGNENAGCDIEMISDKDIRVAKRILSPAMYEEYPEMKREEQQRLFFSVWTIKESVMKAEGKGFLLSPGCIDVDLKRGRAYVTDPEDPEKAAAFREYITHTFYDIPGYVYSYVVRSHGMDLLK